MPELPEVETVRRGLEATVVGCRMDRVKITGRRSVRRQSPAELRRRVEGRRIERADRRGKYLALLLDDGQALVIHLRMSGQLLYVPQPARLRAAKHTHVVVRMEGGAELRFVDARTFGEWYVTRDVRDDGLPAEFDAFGPDPFADGLPVRVLRGRLAGRRTALKVALTNQAVIAGLGNIYADEICFVARLRPERLAGSLDDEESRRLARAIGSVLTDAVQLRGSSLRDASYRDLMGELGEYQGRHCVYGRAGADCPRCGHEVQKLKIGARSAYACEHCQG
ncbi:MAG: bifunctional DNA-formamidopyrimidine glycosylase/DNA-(apurinic or apyrimidinic site) lyase [Acidimicrobiales bacterium]